MILFDKLILWGFFYGLGILTVSMQDSMLIIGHRGAMGHETENSLASIQKALDMQVDMIEIDVFQIASGEIVVFHDDRIDRLTDSKGSLESLNLEGVKSLTLEGNHKIPLLTEVLDLVNHKVRLNIELKGANTANKVSAILEKYMEEYGWKLDDFVISSFNWEELQLMRQANAHIAIAVLTDKNPLDAVSTAKALSAIAINPYYKTLKKRMVKNIQELGFKVYTYTVNEPEEIEKMRSFGVDGIFTNFPERAK
ncbi:glycerophosphodiester phosphodiesterase [Eudoraea chungangensis]|uniref:glycerophosphodiester phosphodiesterase n=1 Tax=Eudoraea chungangensis TaxID=1481905 RepID=UPI0023EAA890|nr:glycerophosphodiester phosphodiesterase family protein [Eudoraea chungangensis]